MNEEPKEPKPRTYIFFDRVLFPFGVTPGNIIELKGEPQSGKTYLMTYLIAKFLTTYPEKRAIFIDTRHHFSFKTFLRILWGLNSKLNLAKSVEGLQTDVELYSFMERLTVISCYTTEDLLSLFGPKDMGQLETMLVEQPNFSIIFIDALDSFTNCSSVTTPTPADFFDVGKLLKRSVESTKTPVICSLQHYYRSPIKTAEEEEAEEKDLSGFAKPKLYSNIVFDPTIYTHSVELEPVYLTDKAHCEKYKITFTCKAYLRSKSRPRSALSGVNHFVKFSISSGMLVWYND